MDACLDMMLDCVKKGDSENYNRWKHEYDQLKKALGES